MFCWPRRWSLNANFTFFRSKSIFPAQTPPWEGYRKTNFVIMPPNGSIRTSPPAMWGRCAANQGSFGGAVPGSPWCSTHWSIPRPADAPQRSLQRVCDRLSWSSRLSTRSGGRHRHRWGPIIEPEGRLTPLPLWARQGLPEPSAHCRSALCRDRPMQTGRHEKPHCQSGTLKGSLH